MWASSVIFKLFPRDRCNDFLNIFAEKFGKKLAFFAENKLNYAKIGS
jgi:hypothetical protein